MNASADAFMAIFGMKRVKPKTCKACRCKFTPSRPLQTVCGPLCAADIVAKQRKAHAVAKAKEERKAIKAKKEKLKTRSDYMREAQAAVNAFIRARDALLPCISCGRHHDGQWHAGHYLSRGAHPELAFEPLNLAKQCQPCNTHLSGNQIRFRQGLIERIGLDRVEWLEGAHPPKKWGIEELQRIKAEFRKKTKELQCQPMTSITL